MATRTEQEQEEQEEEEITGADLQTTILKIIPEILTLITIIIHHIISSNTTDRVNDMRGN